jgi:hypothetical protein
MQIMHDAQPSGSTRFGAAITIMKEMHWSWGDYMAAPAGLVDEIATRIEAREYWYRKKAELEKKHGGHKSYRSGASQRTQ